MAKIVVEAVDVDVDSKKDGSNDHENVVAHKLLSNGIVKSRRSWRGCIELGEWMDQQLGWRKEQIYCNKTEQFTYDIDTSKNNGPFSLANLAESEEGSENTVSIAAGENLVSGDGGRVHPKHVQDDADEDTNSQDCSKEDDNDHDVVPPNVL